MEAIHQRVEELLSNPDKLPKHERRNVFVESLAKMPKNPVKWGGDPNNIPLLARVIADDPNPDFVKRLFRETPVRLSFSNQSGGGLGMGRLYGISIETMGVIMEAGFDTSSFDLAGLSFGLIVFQKLIKSEISMDEFIEACQMGIDTNAPIGSSPVVRALDHIESNNELKELATHAIYCMILYGAHLNEEDINGATSYQRCVKLGLPTTPAEIYKAPDLPGSLREAARWYYQIDASASLDDCVQSLQSKKDWGRVIRAREEEQINMYESDPTTGCDGPDLITASSDVGEFAAEQIYSFNGHCFHVSEIPKLLANGSDPFTNKALTVDEREALFKVARAGHIIPISEMYDSDVKIEIEPIPLINALISQYKSFLFKSDPYTDYDAVLQFSISDIWLALYDFKKFDPNVTSKNIRKKVNNLFTEIGRVYDPFNKQKLSERAVSVFRVRYMKIMLEALSAKPSYQIMIHGAFKLIIDIRTTLEQINRHYLTRQKKMFNGEIVVDSYGRSQTDGDININLVEALGNQGIQFYPTLLTLNDHTEFRAIMMSHDPSPDLQLDEYVNAVIRMSELFDNGDNYHGENPNDPEGNRNLAFIRESGVVVHRYLSIAAASYKIDKA